LTHRLAQLAQLVNGRVAGDPEIEIDSIRSLAKAGPRDLSFLTNPKYRRDALASEAGALLVSPALEHLEGNLLVVDEPYFSLSQLLDLYFPTSDAAAGIHPAAIIEPGASVASSAAVGAFSVIGSGTRIQAGAVVHSHVVIGKDCEIGENSELLPRVVLYDRVRLGSRCRLHAGVVLGSDGFGYALHAGEHVKLTHAGTVIVEDDVEIGANTTIDRALLDETRIGAGSKIDNLVQVAHNVEVGKGCLLISQSGIAGSTRLGDAVVLAGQVGISGHLELGDGTQVAAKSAVFKSVPAGKKVAGIPAVEASAWRRQQALVRRLADLSRRLRRLEHQQEPKLEENGLE
jgi:UDP-3-O-[3-hydroxymyristoyl] glucosamine N-acyltransferase